MISVVVDDKIPYIREALALMGVEAQYVAGSAITATTVRDADAKSTLLPISLLTTVTLHVNIVHILRFFKI